MVWEEGRKEGSVVFEVVASLQPVPVSRDSSRWGWPRLFIQNFWWLPTGADELRLSPPRLALRSWRRAAIGWDSGHCPVLVTGDRPWPLGSLTNREAGGRFGCRERESWAHSCVTAEGSQSVVEWRTTSFPLWPPEVQHNTHWTPPSGTCQPASHSEPGGREIINFNKVTTLTGPHTLQHWTVNNIYQLSDWIDQP